ncbi:MAG: hypothetical protein ACREOL_02075 [Candidatus Dormibacteria bacterium]
MADPTVIATGAFTLGGALVGFAGGTVGQLLRGRSQAAAASPADPTQQREELRRRVLMDFQEALEVYLRCVGRVHYADVRAAKADGSWGRPQRSPRLELELLEAGRRARQTGAWVIDDQLRQHFEALDRQITVGLRRLASEAAAGHFTVRTGNLLQLTQERLGYLLRPLL